MLHFSITITGIHTYHILSFLCCELFKSRNSAVTVKPNIKDDYLNPEPFNIRGVPSTWIILVDITIMGIFQKYKAFNGPQFICHKCVKSTLDHNWGLLTEFIQGGGWTNT